MRTFLLVCLLSLNASPAKAEISDQLISCAESGRKEIKAKLGPLLDEARTASLYAEELFRPFINEQDTDYLDAKAKADALNSQARALSALIPSDGNGHGAPMTLERMKKLLNAQCDFVQKNEDRN